MSCFQRDVAHTSHYVISYLEIIYWKRGKKINKVGVRGLEKGRGAEMLGRTIETQESKKN